jgi:hypothetical protein
VPVSGTVLGNTAVDAGLSAALPVSVKVEANVIGVDRTLSPAVPVSVIGVLANDTPATESPGVPVSGTALGNTALDAGLSAAVPVSVRV